MSDKNESPKDDLKERKASFTKEFEELKKKYNLDFSPLLNFPEYRIIPDDVQLALVVINKHKTNYILNLVEVKPNDDKI